MENPKDGNVPNQPYRRRVAGGPRPVVLRNPYGPGHKGAKTAEIVIRAQAAFNRTQLAWYLAHSSNLCCKIIGLESAQKMG
jgi:hypothetical protein